MGEADVVGKKHLQGDACEGRQELWRSRGHRRFLLSGLGEGREKEK